MLVALPRDIRGVHDHVSAVTTPSLRAQRAAIRPQNANCASTCAEMILTL